MSVEQQPSERGARKVRLVVSDVDGTLITPGHVLTPRTRSAVARLAAAGVGFAIASGRPPRGMAMLVEALGITTPLAAFNGGMIVRPDLATVIEQSPLPPEIGREVVASLRRAGLDVWVYRGTDWFVQDARAPHVAQEQATVQFAPTVVSDVVDVLLGAVKIVGVSERHDAVASCESGLRAEIEAHASIGRSQPYYLDVTHPDANKGSVIRTMSRLLAIPPEEILALGDMPTDVLMFAVAGCGIAMGNATRDVQRAARHVTATNEHDGFAAAMERYVLPEAVTSS